MGLLELHQPKLWCVCTIYFWMPVNWCGAGTIQRKSSPENGKITFHLFQEIAAPARAVNGQDERRTLCAAIDRPAQSCSAVIKAGKFQGACPPLLILVWGLIETCLNFCDTILILRKWLALKSRQNINIFTIVFPAKILKPPLYIVEITEVDKPGLF